MNRIKKLAKCVFHGACKYTGAARLQEAVAHQAGKQFMVILVFHRVTDRIPEDGLTVSTARFLAICRLLQRSFRVVPVAELARLHRNGEMPPRTVAITFDDCYHDNLFAARVLAEHGLTASFFIPTAFVGTDHVFPWDQDLPQMPNLTWDDVREMSALGHTIGSHTVNHPNLGEVPLDIAQREISDSKRIIEDRLGLPVRWFAYPYGGIEHFSPRLTSFVLEAGYDGCLSAHGGRVHPDTDSRLLPREPAPGFDSLLNLELHLRGCLDWFYALKRRFGVPDHNPQQTPVFSRSIRPAPAYDLRNGPFEERIIERATADALRMERL